MAYIPETHIWGSINGKEIYYQNEPPTGIRSVLIASRGNIVNPFFVQKYGLQPQASPVVEPVNVDVETVAESHFVETKIVEPETPEKQFKPKRKSDND
jgi:hypothetical protein